MDGIAESGVAIEVSTAGLRKPVGEIYPALPFLEMCLEAGLPGGAVERRPRARAARPRVRARGRVAGERGVTELAVFEGRERRLEPIG